MSAIVWTTKDGIKVKVKDMTNSHLANTIRLIELRCREIYEEEQSEPAAGDEWHIELPDIYFSMRREAKKRKIIDETFEQVKRSRLRNLKEDMRVEFDD